MKISASKKQLAKIISENGGWRDGAGFVAQDQNASVTFFVDAPWRCETTWEASEFEALSGFGVIEKSLPNWHQTVLSRDEYFHLYPASDAEGEEPEHVWTNPPTIEQLASDYRAKLAIAQQAQEEADTHRCGADAALSRLENACLELGFEIKPASGRAIADMTPKLTITDWRDLRVGDVIWIGDSANTSNAPSGEYTVIEFDPEYLAGRTLSEQYGIAQPIRVNGGHWPDLIERKWRFIRRPAKGAVNA